MKTSAIRKVLLGVAITTSIGIGYAIGAQPHMDESLAMLQSARAELTKQRRTRAATASARSA